MASKKLCNKTVCVVGLGYVGLPLAQDFSQHIRTIGYCRDNTIAQQNIPYRTLTLCQSRHNIPILQQESQ